LASCGSNNLRTGSGIPCHLPVVLCHHGTTFTAAAPLPAITFRLPYHGSWTTPRRLSLLLLSAFLRGFIYARASCVVHLYAPHIPPCWFRALTRCLFTNGHGRTSRTLAVSVPPFVPAGGFALPPDVIFRSCICGCGVDCLYYGSPCRCAGLFMLYPITPFLFRPASLLRFLV